MRYFARVSLERTKTEQYGHVLHCLSRGMPELTEEQFSAVMAFDKMSQADRLAVIVAGVSYRQTFHNEAAAARLLALDNQLRDPVSPISLTEYLEAVQHLHDQEGLS